MHNWLKLLEKELTVVLAVLITASFAVWADASPGVNFNLTILPEGGEQQGGGSGGSTNAPVPAQPEPISPIAPPSSLPTVPVIMLPINKHSPEDVNPSNYAASVVSKPGSLVLRPNQSVKLEAVVRNTGSAAWAFDKHPVRLGVIGDKTSQFRHPDWRISNRPRLVYTLSDGQVGISHHKKDVRPGEILTMTFNIKAPTKTGTYKEDWGLLAEWLTWMPQTNFQLKVRVSNTAKVVVPQAAKPSVTEATKSVSINATLTPKIVGPTPSAEKMNPVNNAWHDLVGKFKLWISQIAGGKNLGVAKL